MRIRTVKPEFWTSENVAKLDRDSRLVFIGLWNFCDDAGRAKANPKVIAGYLLPFDEDSREVVESSLNALRSVGCIRIYINDGIEYLDIPNFLKHQKINKPTKSRIPSFDDASSTPIGSFNESSMNTTVGFNESSMTPTCRKGKGKGKGNGMEIEREREIEKDGGMENSMSTNVSTPCQQMSTASTQAEAEAEAEAEANTLTKVSVIKQGLPLSFEKSKKQPSDFYERPSLDEVKFEAVRIGLPEWRAEIWWYDMESTGWIIKGGVEIKKWRPALMKVKDWWIKDGMPSHQNQKVNGNGQQKQGGHSGKYDSQEYIEPKIINIH